MEDICLSCPCYLSLQSLLQLTRFESYYCCLAATAVVLAASVPAIAATAPADEDYHTEKLWTSSCLNVRKEEEEEVVKKF